MIIFCKFSKPIEKNFFTLKHFADIRGANQAHCGLPLMTTANEEIEVEDDPVVQDSDDTSAPPVEVAKTNLAKRRVIDNLLDERRLRKQLSDYDFDL